jgi:glycosyltransferase involved in cell wall biosynthesis
VLRSADQHGWTVRADFADLQVILASASLGLVPLVHASGIQTKVLEAAASGLPQVVSPVALAGMAPGFPVAEAADDRTMIEQIALLLEDDAGRRRLGEASRDHIAERYTAAAWQPWATELLARTDR